MAQQPRQQGSNTSGPSRPKTSRAAPSRAPANATGQGATDLETGSQADDRERSLSARVTGLAQNAADEVASIAGSGASRLSRRVTSLLDRKMANGVDIISHVAQTTRSAADDLDEDIPQVAEAIRSVADSVDDYADRLRQRSVEDLVGSASRFTREQPALVFGAAALLGFLVFRSFSSASRPETREAGPSRRLPMDEAGGMDSVS